VLLAGRRSSEKEVTRHARVRSVVFSIKSPHHHSSCHTWYGGRQSVGGNDGASFGLNEGYFYLNEVMR
jgi:hypothetical protein